MTGWPYALGTLLCWIGLAGILMVVAKLSRAFFDTHGADKAGDRKLALIYAVTAGVALVLSAPLLRGHEGGAVFLPLIWIILPFAGWMAVICFAIGLGRLTRLLFAVSQERTSLLRNGIGFLLAGLVGVYFFRRDPSNTIGLLKGVIPLTGQTAAGLAILAIAVTVAMAYANRKAKSRGLAKNVASHIALLIGSVLFGIPFLWLLLTSFKEDVDMASSNGLVWIPKVEQTVSYMNKDNPLLEGEFEGMTVQSEIQARYPDGTVLLNILKPGAIAGRSYTAPLSGLKEIPWEVPLATTKYNGQPVTVMIIDELADGSEKLQITEPANLKGTQFKALPADVDKIRHVGLKWQNYPLALDYMPPEAHRGLTYLGNTLYLVFFSVVGTLLSSSIIAYAFSRLRFPGRDALFNLMLSTMMLPAAVTMMPQFLIFRSLGWVDTLRPLWVPAFLGSAFNIFLLRQFLMNIPMELEDAAKIDGCSYLKTFWSVMIPQITPALAVIGIWTFMGAWNNFMGPLIYVSSPEHMPISYALQMYNSDRGGEPGLLMAFTTLSMLPVLGLFFFAQRYFIEGVTLSGLGGR